jgi:dCMP deaminase
MPKRISKQQYYMNIAREVSKQCSCFRARHGAVIVKDDQIIATGYIGAPRKTKDCLERNNCLRRELGIPSGQRYELCRSVHAEQNAIINAARAGVSILGARLFLYSVKLDEEGEETIIDALPCFICKKLIVNSGMEEVVSMRADSSMKTYQVADWVADWQENDLLDDMEQYGLKTIKEKNK